MHLYAAAAVLGCIKRYFALASAIGCTCATTVGSTRSDGLGFGDRPIWLGSVVSISRPIHHQKSAKPSEKAFHGIMADYHLP